MTVYADIVGRYYELEEFTIFEFTISEKTRESNLTKIFIQVITR